MPGRHPQLSFCAVNAPFLIGTCENLSGALNLEKKSPDEIFEFCKLWKGKIPLMIVPTAYPAVTLDELKSHGVTMVVYAHQTTLAAFAAVSDVIKQMSKIKSLSDLNTKLASMDDLFKLQGMHKIREHESFIEEEIKKLDLD